MAARDVVLHVYKLAPEEGSNGSSFFSSFLPAIGLAAYHTSLELDGYRFTFGRQCGIIRTSSRKEGVPTGATYQESIPLGSCPLSRGELTVIMKKLAETFTNTSYHLVHRNCNHFSETMATCVVLDWAHVDATNKNTRLDTYPHWINRLAKTGSVVVSHDEDIVPCNVLAEASKAAGADDKIKWDFKKQEKTKVQGPSKRHSKRTLTEAQKAALVKLRKK